MTKNFTLKELTYNRWANNISDYESRLGLSEEILSNLKELAENLEVLRAYLGNPIYISIAYRPLWWELKQGRSGKGQHPLGKASDIKVKGLTPKEIKGAIEHLIKDGKMKQGGIGLYNTFVHYDIRGIKARW